MPPLQDTLWLPSTDAEHDEAQVQLQRLLSSPAFRNSQRYPALLRFVVEQTLAGSGDQLKERTIGIAVFHRAPDYDTNTDPVVRVTAGEVRKRLVQYYYEHPDELRIELPSGSYVPLFSPSSGLTVAPAPGAAESAIPGESEVAPAQESTAASKRRRRRWPVALAAGVLFASILCAAVLLLQQRLRAHDPMTELWAPMVQSNGEAALILGGRAALYLGADGQPPHGLPATQGKPGSTQLDVVNTVTVSDALSFARVASFLSRREAKYVGTSAAQTTLEDLRARPAVLFGAFNNSWTLHATDQLRFQLRMEEPAGFKWIRDRDHAGARNWALKQNQPMMQVMRDYAVVARYFDTETEQEVMIAAGLGENGTTAASEFLTNGHYLQQLNNFSPRGRWDGRNFEAVIETEVVEGRSGAPRVVAATLW